MRPGDPGLFRNERVARVPRLTSGQVLMNRTRPADDPNAPGVESESPKNGANPSTGVPRLPGPGFFAHRGVAPCSALGRVGTV